MTIPVDHKIISSTVLDKNDYTIIKPDTKEILYSIACVINSQIRSQSTKDDNDDLFAIFNEEQYWVTKKLLDLDKIFSIQQTPDVEDIYYFLQRLFESLLFCIECFIVALIYINRLLVFSNLHLNSKNWRSIMFCSLIIARKVWNDTLLKNNDVLKIYPLYTLEEINIMEKCFLDLIQYNVIVTSTLYLKYYFELRSLNFCDKINKNMLSEADLSDEIETKTKEYSLKFEKQKLSSTTYN